MCKGKDTRIVDYCRTVVDFLDCCGGGLFLASDTRTDLLPPQPLTLIKGVASPVPSDAIVRLHLKLLALLRNEYRPGSCLHATLQLLASGFSVWCWKDPYCPDLVLSQITCGSRTIQLLHSSLACL